MIMTEPTNTPPQETVKEKKLRKLIEERLAITLLEYKPLLGDKKFETRIRKAGKLFAADIIQLSAGSKKKKADKKKHKK